MNEEQSAQSQIPSSPEHNESNNPSRSRSPSPPPPPLPPRPNAATAIAEEHSPVLQIKDDYFPPSPALVSQFKNLSTGDPSNVAPQPTVQSTTTTALSLPQGVMAVTSDPGESSRSATRPASQGEDSNSLQSAVLQGSVEEDVQGMVSGAYIDGSDLRGGYSTDDGREVHTSDSESDYPDEYDDGGTTRGVWASHRKHFFILTAAGKPVYSRHGSEEMISDYMGVLQTIISFFQQNNDPLHSFVAGRWKFSIMSTGYLYLVAASSASHESEFQLRVQLDALYTQILSTLTLTQVKTVFSRRESFDLRRLLGGTEVFLDGLADSMALGNPSVLFGSVECVRIRKSHREAITNLFLKNRTKSLLYGLIIAVDPVISMDSPYWGCGRLVSVIRPKRHSLHPPDLQLIFSMLSTSATFRDTVGSEHWTPLCLPKFNAEGFLYAYISYFDENLAMILLSPEKEGFFEMKNCKEAFLEECAKKDALRPVHESLALGRPTVQQILVSVAGRVAIAPYIPCVLHFLYKSKPHVQFFTPAMPDPEYCSRQQVMSTYSRLYDQLHGKAVGHVKYAEIRVGGGLYGIGWISKGWELYVVAGNQRQGWRDGIGRIAGEIVKWAASQEERIFVVGGGVF